MKSFQPKLNMRTNAMQMLGNEDEEKVGSNKIIAYYYYIRPNLPSTGETLDSGYVDEKLVVISYFARNFVPK